MLIEANKLEYNLGVFNEKMQLDRNRISIIVCDTKKGEKKGEKKEEIKLNEYGFAIAEKVQYTYGPPHRYIKGGIKEVMQPKEVYKLVNPENELCQFDISCGSKMYSFFHNKVNGKTFRHFTVVECKNYDF